MMSSVPIGNALRASLLPVSRERERDVGRLHLLSFARPAQRNGRQVCRAPSVGRTAQRLAGPSDPSARPPRRGRPNDPTPTQPFNRDQKKSMLPRALLLLALLADAAFALDNGLARLPPLGWRSWNSFGGSVTQDKMEAVMAAMVDTSRGVSLLSLGYEFVGLDDGWQACGTGVNGSFHDARGDPLIDNRKFPDLGRMVAKAHALGLKAGWYLNNCICLERGIEGKLADLIPERSVAALRRFGFDGVKLDSCSQWNNLTQWNALSASVRAAPGPRAPEPLC